MPLIAAVIVFAGSFFGYAGIDSAHDRMLEANKVQQYWLELKHAAIAKVAAETLNQKLEVK